MEAGLVRLHRRHGREPAHGLDADRDAEQRRASVGMVPLASRQHRRHDHRAGMHRTALEGVVEILAMRRGAVDEGGAGRGHGARVPDGRAGAVVLPAGERGLDVVGVAHGDAEAGDVDQEVLAGTPHRGGQLSRRRARRSCWRDARRRRFQEVLRPCVFVASSSLRCRMVPCPNVPSPLAGEGQGGGWPQILNPEPPPFPPLPHKGEGAGSIRGTALP